MDVLRDLVIIIIVYDQEQSISEYTNRVLINLTNSFDSLISAFEI